MNLEYREVIALCDKKNGHTTFFLKWIFQHTKKGRVLSKQGQALIVFMQKENEAQEPNSPHASSLQISLY
jgi:hypothetical protein